MADGGVAPLGMRRDIGQLVGHNGGDRPDGRRGGMTEAIGLAVVWGGYGQKYSGHQV